MSDDETAVEMAEPQGLPTEERVPVWYGTIPDLTGDEDAVDYIRRLRE